MQYPRTATSFRDHTCPPYLRLKLTSDSPSDIVERTARFACYATQSWRQDRGRLPWEITVPHRGFWGTKRQNFGFSHFRIWSFSHLPFFIPSTSYKYVALNLMFPFVTRTLYLSIVMAETLREPSKVSSTKKSIRQKRDRRKNTLENKLQQYSDMCGADVCLGIRIRESGEVYIFSADSSGFWSFLRSQLVCSLGLSKLSGSLNFPDSY